MAEQKKPVDFNEMIQADRARRKNSQLAADIFGRNRKKNETPNRSASNSPSLASRIGVGKRTTSSASNSGNNPFRPTNSRNNSSSSAQRDRANRVSHAINASTSHQQTSRPSGLSIKGKAGPWTVVANNFAPGTTADDIEATLSRDAVDDDGRSGLLSCRLLAAQPNVMAELVFTERAIADRIISTYNNQLADGRYLKLSYQKQQPQSKAPAPAKVPAPSKPEPSPRNEPEEYAEDADMMAVEDAPSTQATVGGATETNSRYDSDREAAAAGRDRRERENRLDDREHDRPREREHDRDPRDAPRGNDGGRREEERSERQSHPRDRERDMRDRRYDDRGGYERRYDDRPRYDDRGPPPYRGGGGGGGRGWGGGVRGSYARAAGLNGDGRGNYQGYR